jgi:thiaminase
MTSLLCTIVLYGYSHKKLRSYLKPLAIATAILFPGTMTTKPWSSLTNHLLSLDPDQYTHATQSPFLHLAARGQIPKSLLSSWLANDRLYIHAYIKGTGALLRTVNLPQSSRPSSAPDAVETRLLDWLIEALVNVRKEERFFTDVAERYGLKLNLPEENGAVPDSMKSEGLRLFETVFEKAAVGPETGSLPWLEGAVVFWATEKCYLDAWSWARAQIPESTSSASDTSGDADGGALRREFIPNWSSLEFAKFVDQLGEIIDEGVNEALSLQSPDRVEELKRGLEERAHMKWVYVLEAETAFWPDVGDVED